MLRGCFISQKKYATEVLDRAGMLNCKPCRTPVDTDSKLSADGAPISDSTLYRDPIWGLYSILTLPGLLFSYADSASAYSDVIGRVVPLLVDKTSVIVFFLATIFSPGHRRRPHFLSRRSCAEAEYRGVANAVAETCWLRNLLRELHTPLATATLVYCDNVSAVYLSSNPVQHQRTKHIEIDIYFVRDLVATGAIRVLHVPSRYQYANIFTKCLPTSLFDEFRTSLSVRSSPVQTAVEC
ncbi:ribonuclease H-like domain-containing protein [Tanacetum coccineum]|uniref:Ribonuclease H-like domain-containing protein n=1 Tax=Tanacetum coccineum TaxID=301880 RepID=A0ABQ4YWI2_9ASTR